MALKNAGMQKNDLEVSKHLVNISALCFSFYHYLGKRHPCPHHPTQYTAQHVTLGRMKKVWLTSPSSCFMRSKAWWHILVPPKWSLRNLRRWPMARGHRSLSLVKFRNWIQAGLIAKSSLCLYSTLSQMVSCLAWLWP